MANLSPELLARIQAYYAQPASGSGWSPNMATPFSEGGRMYQSDAQQGWGQDGGGATGMTSLFEYDPNKTQAGQDKFNVYDPQGTFLNEGTFKTDDAGKMLALALAAAGGMSMLPAAGGAGGALPGGAGMDVAGFEGLADVGLGGANGVGTLAGDAFLPGQLGVNGANLSAAIPGTSFMNSSGLNTLLSGAGLAGGGAAAGTAGAAGTAAKWLGPAATLLGAAAGAKGQDSSQTSVKSMDPRMDALFYGDLAPRVQGLLAKQMAPGAMQGFTDMQSVGRNLLNAPVAGNGFNRFFPGK